MIGRARLFLPCAAGTEGLLARELGGLLGGAVPLQPQRGGVALEGDAALAMRLNLESRLAQRVLWQIAHAPYRGEDDLYALARGIDWTAWITPQQTLRVDVTAQHAPLKSLNFAALRVKDAVCDTLRDALGARPSVDTRAPDLSIVLHVDATHATLYLDTSGEALFKRGWRDALGDKGEAPLKETLAAAMLAAADWQGRADDAPLFDPCCGAGTIVIEAAQIACGIAPGLARRFAFERWLPFTQSTLRAQWRDLREAAQARVHRSAVPIFASDVSFRMTDFAARNAERAGVRGAIEFKTADALQRPAPAERGVMLLNPPYGERIEAKGRGAGPRVLRADGRERAMREAPVSDDATQQFFEQLAATWKRQYAGWTAWVLSPDAKLPQRMRLKESARVPMWNGPIECRLFRFDMVAGSMRKPAAPERTDDAG